MRKKHLQISLILTIIILIIPSTAFVSGIGLSPAEMRVIDAVGSGVIGSIVLVNSEGELKNFILQIQSPSELPTEEEHLRVICEDCYETHQRYEIINEICPNCDSENLVIYERIPDNILQYLDLNGVDCELIKKDNYYYTNEKFTQNEQCTVEILLDLPNKEEYSNKHWEAHITATTTSDINNIGMGVLAGVQMRLLLDVPTIKSSISTPAGINPMIFLYIIIFSIIILCLYLLIKRGYLTKENLRLSKKYKIKSSKKNPSTFYLGKIGNYNNYKVSPSNKSYKHKTVKKKSANKSKSTFIKSKQKKPFSDIKKEIDKILKINEKK
jgi:hypothetical protein